MNSIILLCVGFGVGFTVKTIHSLVVNHRIIKMIKEISDILDAKNLEEVEYLKEMMGIITLSHRGD